MEWPTGGLTEFESFELVLETLSTGLVPCPHTQNGEATLAVVARNEGGHNSTAVCLACILDAMRACVERAERP